ncbi:MAG: hypothetical protein Tsb0014_21260 [Pleurocapsa sp.]
MNVSRITCLGVSIGTFGLLNVLSLPALGEDYIGNRGIRFEQDTIIEFEFLESHGAYQSTFGVIDLDSCQTDVAGVINFDTCVKTPLLEEVKPSDVFETVNRQSSYETSQGASNDFVGTPGNTVPKFVTEFTFQANRKYAFYLESQYRGKPTGIVYSLDLLNSKGNRQVLFSKETLSTEEVAQRDRNTRFSENKFDSLIDGGVLLSIDDTGSALVRDSLQDTDFDDFKVGLGGGYTCDYPKPEQIKPSGLQSRRVEK